MNKSAEIICVGTELLLGDILNSNVQYLAQQLASLGIAHHYQTVVGDNPTRIKQAVAIACDRARLIILTGGLGPTPDDLTLASLADFFDTSLVERPEIVAVLEEKFARRGQPLTSMSRRQALLPEGAEELPNPIGSAPGVIWSPRSGLTIMTFPGVPWEMKAMWQASAVPYLRANGWANGVIHSRILKFWGIGESTLARQVESFLSVENPTVAPYALGGKVTLRISARAESVTAATQLIDPVAIKIKEITGTACYGQDDQSLAEVVGELLKARSQTLSVAESCTGGSLGGLITAIPGSSSYFWGGVISYDNQVKQQILGVDKAVLARCGAVSAEVAAAMAVGVRDRLGTDWALSITGIAGPGGGSDEKPVGLVYIGLASAGGTKTEKHLFGQEASRDRIRQQSALSALNLIRLSLLRSQEDTAGAGS
ncbi:competence/damage-inducible protein A [cf. Phormidesmis sp. LEGE 11477]|uniref:competence/damage-inducible protein A n=1 Tax=cf. Phormidesmis sp. LEGE 11477 TaxID=1828680 RepID=UPI001882C92D|nr:competence/damage-inducible protein A [cf. Phormidesmis sp. LEGE 11477]MBE9063671.1 competence/damage-inducible protein A [cf. Phormidesmis sp. LEGE 11477]